MERINSIDIFRGIAVFFVFAYHSMLLIFWGHDISYLPNGLFDISQLSHISSLFLPYKLGWVGVKLFFVLSGFSIHLGTLKLKINLPTIDFCRDFFIKRFFRIYPAYLFAIIFIILHPILISYFRPIIFSVPTTQIILVNLFFLYNYTCCTLTPAFWSLGAEVQLYLIYPLFLFLKNHFSTKIILIYSLFISMSCIVIFNYINSDGLKLGFVGSVLFDWLLGVYLAERFYQGLPQIFDKKYIFYGTIVVFFCLAMYRPTLDLASTISSFFSFLIIQKFIYKSEIKGKIANMFCSIGKSSYSIYLIHMPLMPYFLAIYHKVIPINPITDMSIGIPFTFGLTYLVGSIMYNCIESPMILVGKKVLIRLQNSNFTPKSY